MDDPVATAILNQYFHRLEHALAGLPAVHRHQILEDLRAHVEESLADEPIRSDESVLAVLDRVGDPDEIARAAIADAVDEPSPVSDTTTPSRAMARRLGLGLPIVLSVVAVIVAVVAVTNGSSSAAPRRARIPTSAAARNTAGGGVPVSVTKGGWLSAGSVSGDHHSPGASDCGPQTLTGAESAARLEASASQVASGTIDGHPWSLWSEHGQRGADGLENGGLVVDGVAHGLCPGFPNPAEMELLDPSGGGDGLAYGVVGYPGAAKIDMYRGTVETFDRGKLLSSATAQVLDGVGFFITALPASACSYRSLEQNTTSKHDSAEHNLGFATSHCSPGQLVPINWSQGIWALPAGQFQTGAGSSGPPPPGGSDVSGCSPPTNASTSGGNAATIINNATRAASGTLDGHSWSLWSRRGQTGSVALEDAGVILDAHSYGLCPGAPNPAELELIDPADGRRGVVIGVSGYHGPATVSVTIGTPGTFKAGQTLYSAHTIAADGTGFFIAQLPKSACDYPSLELTTQAGANHSQHNFGFGTCRAGKLVKMTQSMGAWSGP